MNLTFSSDARISIKTKVAATTLITVALVLIISMSLLYLKAHQILEESIFHQQFTMASELAGQMEQRIQLAHQQLAILSAAITPEIIEDKIKIDELLTHAGPAQALFDGGFLLLRPDGSVIVEDMGYPELETMNFNFREYVKETVKTGKPYISTPFRLATPPYTPMIAFAHPVRDNNDRIFCLIVGYHTLGTGQFLTSFSSEKLGNNAYLYILSGRTILMHNDTRRILETVGKGKNPGIDRTVEEQFEGSLENFNSKGKHLLSSFKRIRGTDWVISVNIPYSDAFSTLYSLRFVLILIVITGIGFSSMIIWLVTNRLTRPVSDLIEHINKHQDDNTPWQPLDLKTGDELEELSIAYDKAMGDVQQTRSALKNEKEFFGSIIQNAGTPMFILDSNHRIIFWNNALAKLTGKSSFQMVGTKRQWEPFYDSKRPVMADLILEHAMKSQVDMLYEHNTNSAFTAGALKAEGWYDLNGSSYYLFFEAAPVRNHAGEIIAAVETLEDITERKIMEDKLSRLTRAVEQSPATIVMTDVDGTIEYVNPKFIQTTGYSFDEAIGQNPRVLKSGELDPSGYKELWGVISSGREWRGEFHNKRKDGTLYWEFASISPLFDKTGKINGYLAVKEDITARKVVEAELVESHRKLEQLFQQVSQGKREWEETLDHLHDFVILTDSNHRVRRYNKLLQESTGKSYQELLNTDWRELLADSGFTFIAFNGSSGEIRHNRSARMYDLKVYPITDNGEVTGMVVSLNDTTELRETTAELEKAYEELKMAQIC